MWVGREVRARAGRAVSLACGKRDRAEAVAAWAVTEGDEAGVVVEDALGTEGGAITPLHATRMILVCWGLESENPFTQKKVSNSAAELLVKSVDRFCGQVAFTGAIDDSVCPCLYPGAG